MPGFVNNDWQNYLKGYSQHYNFNYTNGAHIKHGSLDTVIALKQKSESKIPFPVIKTKNKQNYSQKLGETSGTRHNKK